MSRHRPSSSNSSGQRAAEPSTSRRIDVSSQPSSLRQSPFAALAGQSAPSALAATEDAAPSTRTPPAQSSLPAKRGRLVLRRETKHRGGKTVVVISGFATHALQSADTLHAVEKHIKARLGCGGASDVERAEVIIQGDRPDAIADLLRSLGYDVAGVTASPKAARPR